MKFYFHLYHFLSTKSNLQMAAGLTTISKLKNIHKHLKEALHDAKIDPSIRYQMGYDEWVLLKLFETPAPSLLRR